MAKQVSNIFINLGIKNAEGLDKLKSAFRELDKAVGPTSKSIDSAIAAVKRFSDSNERSEQLIRGQIEAFKGLRSQVDVGGNRYSALTNEIGRLQAELRGSTDALERQREKLLRTASAGNQNAKSLQNQIASLERLRQQTRPGSSAFIQLGKDIDAATVSLGKFKSVASQAAQIASQGIGASFFKAGRQVQALQADLQTLNFSSAEFLNRQKEINRILNQQASSVGRQNVRANAAVYTDPGYSEYMERRGRNLPLPATPAGYQQRIGEINAELENISNLERRRELTLELDKLNRQLKGTIIDATSAEQRAVDVVRARVNAQREVLGRSGFGAFSAGVTGRNFKAEQQQQTVADVKTAFASIEQARDTMDESIRAATRRTTQLELNAAQLIEESDQRFHTARMRRKQQEFETEVKAFDILLQSRNIESVIERRKRTLQGEIGIPTTRDLSPFYESVVGLGTALPRRSQQFMGRAPQQVLGDIMYQASAGKILDPVNQDLKTFNTLSDLSTSSIGELSSALGKLKTELRPIDAGYKQLNASIERNEKIIEDTLRKRGNAQRQRLGGQQLAQIAGASISGGIFGGPEGLIGGIAGGILGGVGGSFAGAAAGAQVGMVRQQLGGTAEYAAQIGKLQIALRGVAGSQSNYTQALSAAAAATRDLNVPQMEAIQGITRLSAAVLGAGGTIGDANFAFRAISESIKATGGNAEQVDGAMLALTQVFSKGKVSAEELNQIAERLPGTFTLFAQATGKSGPELQKALQQGQVGLNDLMKFLEVASSKYGQTALGIAASSEDAGARMKIAFDQMRLEVGKALQPIGAELQTSFAKFAKDVTPTVISLSKGIAELLKVIVDNGTAIVTITKLGVEFTAAVYAIRAFTALMGPLKFALALVKVSMADMAVAANMAKLQFQGFATTVKTAAVSLAAPIILTVGIVGVEIVLSALREIEDAKNNIDKLNKDMSAPAWLKASGGSALTRPQLIALANNVAKESANVNDQLNALLRQRAQAKATFPGTPEEFEKLMKEGAQGDTNVFNTGSNRLAQLIKEYTKRKDITDARYQILIDALQGAPSGSPTGSRFPVPTGTGATGAETEAERAAKQAAETERRLAQEGIKIQMDGQLKAFEYAVELDRRRYELQKQLSDEASAHEIANLQGGARTIAQAYATYRSRIAEIERGLVEAAQNTSLERERLRTSQAVEAVTAGTGMQGRYRQGSIGPTSTGPHFDIKQVGGGRFGRTDLDQYVQVNGRPLSTGTTLPGGTFDAPRTGRARHGGWDYAFPPGAALELKGGAQWVNLGPSGGNGDMATFKTLDGKTYTILHGKFERTTGGTASTAQGRSQLLREQKTAGKTDYAGLGLGQAEGLQQAGAQVAEQQKSNAFRTLVDTYTQSIRDQNYELRNSNDLNAERNRLIQAGASSEYIDYAMRLVEIRRTEADMISRINLEEKDPEKRAEQLRKLNELYAETGNLLRQNYELSTAFDNSLGLREGAQRYVESIGTLREATAGLAQQGFKGIEDAIVSLATTGTANFAQFATSLLSDMARIIIQQFVMKQLTQAIMGLFGGGGGGGLGNYGVNLGLGFNQIPSFPMGSALPSFAGFAGMAKGGVFAANGIVPYAMGGIVNRPTLFPFANGGAIGTGLMGEAGPEAIMPLQRGPNGKLGVMSAGGGTTNVVVNVDATGGSSVQGDEDRANQLGKAVSAAVQAELVKQKRPGGLLAG